MAVQTWPRRPRRARRPGPRPARAGQARSGGSRRVPARGGPPPDPCRSWQVVQVLTEPRQELRGHVRPLQRELDDRAQVVDRVAGVETAAAELDAANPAALTVRHLRQSLERVGELDLVAPPRGRVL